MRFSKQSLTLHTKFITIRKYSTTELVISAGADRMTAGQADVRHVGARALLDAPRDPRLQDVTALEERNSVVL
jgi:hypothetical protein